MNEPVNPSVGDLNDCGCCEGVSVQIPVEVYNRPSKAAIATRVGTHSQFKQSLLARLSASDLPALQDLKTRDNDDFSIALLDAWATVADVLTFYQERIANESYLGTATERVSILEQARLIGYKLRPGVAASTYLAFTLEDAPGAPRQATIDIGIKVQSIPGPGEQPQTFETIEKIEARAEWNAIKPRLTKRHPIESDRKTFFFEGVVTKLKAGDALLIVPDDGSSPVFRRIAEVIPLPTLQRTEVQLQPPEPIFFILDSYFSVFAAIQQLPSLSYLTGQFFRTTTSAADFHAKATIFNIRPQAVLNELAAIQTPQPSMLAFRTRASLFGYNAPNWKAMPQSVRKAYNPSSSTPITEGEDWSPNLLSRQLNLDTVYSQIVPDSWVVVKTPDSTSITQVKSAKETALADYTLSAKVTQIELKDDVTEPGNFSELRQTTIYAQSEKLELARLPIEEPVSGTQIELNGWIDGLFVGQSLIICGILSQSRGNRACEQASIANVEQVLESEGFTRITLSIKLKNDYVRDTVTIYANVARATHGETKEEVLGSGDASQPYQHFTLRQPPLTYTSASTPSGAESTLQVRVNELLWHEVPTLYGHEPSDRIFVTSIDDDSKTTIEFGDGRTGARLPTGQENVKATYRKGIGLEGNLKAEQLSLLMTRPLGVKRVTNPIAASGGDNPESLERARHNAPLTVLTLDRIVSLQDYEDFARAYAGIAKALATWTWSGQVRGVFVTVAGPNGQDVPNDSITHKNLLSAMQKSGDPYIPLRVQSYRKAFFRIAANVKVDIDYKTELVLAAVEKSLRSHFSFDARAFGQAVSLSEVMAVIQAVPGVLAVDVNQLNRTDSLGGDGLKNPLPAAAPQAGSDATVLAAELLTLDSSPLELGVMP